ncbi:putative exocyst complex component sec8 [Smittium mucronatum]|uniref:Exocyst complex component Sec8 n=1 Tax=Smittium mucronatum TaxID=133383 RepID=A0A1R0H4K5_9FUNG|nr:putative exocyst complex component sec8 [Smittium mucronatum]
MFLKLKKFNPVTVSLQMLDSSSLGKRHEDFQRYHNRLNATLEGIADEYYGGFNNSILTFSGLYDKISCHSVNTTKNNLIKAKRMLTEKSDGLDQLYMKSKQLSEIVLLLNRIEEINKLPSEIQLNIEKKKFLTAVGHLVQAMQFLFDPELRPIEALAGLRQQMEREKENITQVMIEELHNHLYLKSPYTEKGLVFYDESKDDFSTDSNFQSSRKRKDKFSKRDRRGSVSYLNPEMKSEASENPEVDSFGYIELIVESLLLLDKAGDAIDSINSRVKWELSRVVDSVITEVEDRGRLSELAIVGTISDARMKSKIQDQVILQDFIRTLFSRFEARERYSVSARISKELSMKKIKNYTIESLWLAMEQEILMVLSYYLIPNDKDKSDVLEQSRIKRGSSDVNKFFLLNNIWFFFLFFKNLFVMRENEENRFQTKLLYRDVLDRFDSLSIEKSVKVDNFGIEEAVAVDHYANDSLAQRHRTLVSPDIENAPLLFLSASQLTGEVGDEISQKPERGQSIDFLKGFYLQVFLPEAESQITNMFYKSLSASDAFQPLYNYGSEIDRPVFRSAAALAPLIKSYESLHKNPILGVDSDKWKVLVGIAEKYYERSLTRFHTAVSSAEGKKKTSAEWSKNSELLKIISEKLSYYSTKGSSDSQENDLTKLEDQSKKEIEVIDHLKQERSLFYNELIFDPKKLIFLAQLRQSLNYVYNKIVDIEGLDPVGKNKKPTGPSNSQKIMSSLSYYNALATECLVLLRVEIIAHIIYYLDLATRESSYVLDDPELKSFSNLDEMISAILPDQYILALNADLTMLYEKMSFYLFDYELEILFDGISYIMANYLIANVKYIRTFDYMGCQKMYKNIVCLQQNLTNISLTLENGLDLAKTYYSLFENEYKSKETGYILKHISENGVLFSFNEYKQIYDFAYTAKQKDSGTGPKSINDNISRSGDYKACISKLTLLVGAQNVQNNSMGIVDSKKKLNYKRSLISFSRDNDNH